jgi:hypothetical protein
MPNNFSTDPACQALWRFEPGALGQDSKGSNHLTPVNLPVTDTGDYREGSASVDLERDNSQHFTIAEGSLGAGYPFKSGDTVKKATFCFWMKPEWVPGYNVYANIYTKGYYGAATACMEIQLTNSKLRLIWGKDTSWQDTWEVCNISAGRWYHVAVVMDGVNRFWLCRVYDATAGVATSYESAPSANLRIVNANVFVGAYEGGVNTYDGKLDEMVVFNRLLSPMEIDKIRAGIFSGVSAVDVAQALAQAEYQVPPLLKATQNLTQVEYSILPLIKVPQIIGQVEYRQFDPGLYVKQFIVQVEYQEIPPLTCRRKFPVPDARTAWQSQAGRRQFPVVQ